MNEISNLKEEKNHENNFTVSLCIFQVFSKRDLAK